MTTTQTVPPVDPTKAKTEEAEPRSILGDTSGSGIKGRANKTRIFSTSDMKVHLNETDDNSDGDATTKIEADLGKGAAGGTDANVDATLGADGKPVAAGDSKEPSVTSEELANVPQVDPEKIKDLGAYDAAKNKQEFDKEYLKEGQDVNLERLSAEWWLNAQKTGKIEDGKLNEGTYAFLKDHLKLSEATIKQVEKGFLADSRLNMQEAAKKFTAILDSFGGSDAVEQAVTWAKEGGYDEAQRTRFNAIRDSGNSADIQDSIEALMARFAKANPQAPAPKPKPVSRTDSLPASGTGTAKNEGYPNMEAYEVDRKAAAAARRDDHRKGDAMLMAAKEKLAISEFFLKRNRGK